MEMEWSHCGQMTIPQALSEAAAKWPDKFFLDTRGERYTYAEVDREATRIAHGLAALGVVKGERVCSLLDNSADAVFLWFAVNMLGAIYVPINTDLKGEFLRHQLVDADSAIVVADAHYASRVLAIEDDIPEVHMLVSRGAVPETETRMTMIGLDSIRSDNAHRIAPLSEPGDLAMLVYTSGTTGPSKGCMVSHNYACHNALQVLSVSKLTSDDILWTPCPLFHTAAALGALLHAMMAGATVSVYTRFSASHFWPEIERSGATVVQLLSIMLTIVADAPDSETAKRCYGQIRTLYGAPLPAALGAKWKRRFGVKYAAAPLYGMTEASYPFAVPVDTPDIPDGASGRRIPEFDARIVDAAGSECPPGVAGEIILRPRRPDIMFQGYWRHPEATLAASRDFWFHTGDIGKIDEKGFFYYVDRKKDCLRRGGENVSSFEVEAAFLAHPDVAEVAAHAVQSDMSEDDLKVTLVLKPGAALTEDVLCRWSLERVPHYAVPRYIEFRSHLPRTPTGRVQKFLLRSDSVTATTWDRKKSDIVIGRR